MARLKKFLVLSAAEKKIFFKALCGLPMVHLRLRFFGFKNYLARLQRTPLADVHSNIDPSSYSAQTSYLINAAARLVFRREACLERSIMLWSLLQREGIESELKIGVASENKGISAHAWVEIDGEKINENKEIDERFTAFQSPFTTDRKDIS